MIVFPIAINYTNCISIIDITRKKKNIEIVLEESSNENPTKIDLDSIFLFVIIDITEEKNIQTCINCVSIIDISIEKNMETSIGGKSRRKKLSN